MPVKNNIGYSKHTEQKQKDFENIINTQIYIVKCIFNRNQRRKSTYYYFDFNAGCGYYEGHEGSPLIFCRAAEKHKLPYNAIFYEIEESNCYTLHENLIERGMYDEDNKIDIYNSDSSIKIIEHVKNLKYNPYGLIYCDPNGTMPPFETLANITNHCYLDKIDILVYLSATNIKRQFKNQHCKGVKQSLLGFLKSIKKKYWIVREPQGSHQWTFLIGTNWQGFPQFKNQGFYNIENEKGNEIIETLTYTKKDIKKKEQLVKLPLIKIITNTYKQQHLKI